MVEVDDQKGILSIEPIKKLMFTKLIKISLVITLFVYLFHFLFFWMYESTDSFFYWTFANFIGTGQYWTPPPYNYTVPSTMEPPLYSVFLFLVQFAPRPDIIIHFLQLASILISGYFIYRISTTFATHNFALITALVFLLVPAHFIYTGNLVAEPIAVFFISLYLYLLYLIYKRGKHSLFKYLLPFSAVMVLQRYNLITFYGFTIFIFIRKYIVMLNSFQHLSGSRNKFGMTKEVKNVFISFLISLIILTTWILINHNLNGSWRLSNSEGKHLYNRILHFDRLLPPPHNPDFIVFKKIVGEDRDYFLPWWYYEPLLMSALGSETASSQLMGNVSIAALKTNPVRYLFNNIPFFIFAHGSNPTYHDALYRWGGAMSSNCRRLGTIEFCIPLIKSEKITSFWDSTVSATDFFYLQISPYLNYFLLFPAIGYAFFQKNKLIRSFAFLYVSSVLLFVMVEAPIPRYHYIFTPLQIILISYMILRVYDKNTRSQA